MDKDTLFGLQEDILALFRGIRSGLVECDFDNLQCANKPNLCEVFNDIAKEVVMNIEFGTEVTKEQLRTLNENLISFSKEYGVADARKIAAKINCLLEREK